MRKFLQLCFFIFACVGLNAHGNDSSYQEAPYPVDYFYVDEKDSTKDFIRLCVPIDFPNWFALPTSTLEEVQPIGFETIDGKDLTKMRIRFNDHQLNSILDAYNSVLDESERFKWSPPWTWSKCAKCKLSVNAFITGSIIAGCFAAGVTGPGAYAVWQALIVAKYGLAAWEAVRAIAVSGAVSAISEKICKVSGKCD